MQRRRSLWAIAAGALAVPLALRAQAAPKLRIGWLSGAERGPFFPDFRQGLQELGYAAPDTVIEERYGEAARLPELAAELVRAKVGIIVAAGTPSSLAAKQATTVIPIVSVSGNPVAAGLIDSLARPGGNVTGLSIVSVDLQVKWLDLLHELIPKQRRVAILWTGAESVATSRVARARLEAAAASLGVQLLHVAGRTAAELQQAFAAAVKERAGGIIVLSAPVFAAQADHIVRLAADHRLPAMYEHSLFTEAGGLMSYGPDLHRVFRRVAVYVDKIFKGAAPATLPVEQPTQFELVLNAKTAKLLGLTIPQGLLLRADRAIEGTSDSSS
ncbi:MAG: ABC transporter substrate-binding protein [Rubrivivax sp.]